MIRLSAELLDFQRTARRFAEREIAPSALEWDDHPDRFPWEAMRKGGEAGLLSFHLPAAGETEPAFPGLLPPAILIEELAAACAGTAMIFAGHLLATWTLFQAEGSGASRFLAPLLESPAAERPALAGLAWQETEPGRIMTIATATAQGWAVNGRKRLVRSGNLAGLVLVMVQVASEPEPKGLGLAVVPAGSPGFSVEKVERMLGNRICPMAELLFEDCRIPPENLIARGRAEEILEETLALASGLSAAAAIGATRGAFETALRYAGERYQGGRIIIEHDAVAEMLANMEVRLHAARAGLWQACAEAKPSRAELAKAKIFASEAGVDSCLDAVQVLGGYGYMHESGQEKRLRDVQMACHYEETNQALRRLILRESRKGREI